MEPKSGFEVLRVEPKYFKSKVPTGDPNPRPPHAAGYEAVHFRCLQCGHEWRATESRNSRKGYFVKFMSHLFVTCPGCGHQTNVPNPPLP